MGSNKKLIFERRFGLQFPKFIESCQHIYAPAALGVCTVSRNTVLGASALTRSCPQYHSKVL